MTALGLLLAGLGVFLTLAAVRGFNPLAVALEVVRPRSKS